MKMKRVDTAVSPIIGTALLLGMAIALFAILNIVVFSVSKDSPSPPSVNLVGRLDNSEVVIDHQGGDSLFLDTQIVVNIDDTRTEYNASDDNYLDSESRADGVWNLGESLRIHIGDVTGKKVEVVVVDGATSAMVMKALLQEGAN